MASNLMIAGPSTHVTSEPIAFGPFRLDAARAQFERDGRSITLRPQAQHVLVTLLKHRGEYVGYDQMIEEAWDGVLVSKHTVAVTVGAAKKALEEFSGWITYRPKLGYRLHIPATDDLIQKGWHCLERCTQEGIERGLSCFLEAAESDRSDFRACDGASFAYLMLMTYGARPPREVYPRFLEAHKRAAALEGLTPDLRADLAHALHVFDRKRLEAESEAVQAFRERPDSPRVYVRLALLQTSLGRLDDALDTLNSAQPADDLWPVAPSASIWIRYCRRDFDEVVQVGRRALELHPYNPLIRVVYAKSLAELGRVDEALQQHRLACVICPDLSWLEAQEAQCLAESGHAEEATEILDDLQRRRSTEHIDAYDIALLLESLGRRDEAFEELNRALQQRSPFMCMLDVDPKVDALRADARFAEFRSRVFPN